MPGTQSLPKSQLTFLQKLTTDSKIHMEMQGTQNKQNNLEEEQSWETHSSQFQNFKEVFIPILHKSFSKSRKLTNSFYEANITQIPKPIPKQSQRKKIQTNTLY